MKNSLEIICIDDESDILDIYVSILGEKGNPVKPFQSSVEAKKYIEKNVDRIGAIICDVRMPELDGVTLLKEVTSKFGNLPFFLISGFVDSNVLAEIEDKIAGHFVKPFNSTALGDNVLKLISKTETNLSDKIEFGKGFADEALPKVIELEQLFLEMEKRPTDKASVQSIYRILHTLKGTAATIGLSYLAIFCHSFEAKLIPIRDHDQIADKKLISSFLGAQSHLLNFLTDLQNGKLNDIIPFEEFLDSNGVSNFETPNATATSNKISVNVETLNNFVEGIGELTLMRNLILQKIETISNEQFRHSEERSFLLKTLGEMQKIQSSMQTSAENLLKIPFSSISTFINRNVREVCGKLNKTATLNIVGDSVLFDHKSLQALNDSLVHLIRNSVDHGLEKAEIRIEKMKPECGNLKIVVTEESENILLTLSDDGGGINTDKVKDKAIKNNLISLSQSEKMSDHEVNNLIFMPGFSTSDQVTDVSGRGVGLDSVKRSVEDLGGSVTVSSQIGVGSTFSITVPKNRSVSIVKVAVVKSKKLPRFAIPANELVIIEKAEKVNEEKRFLIRDGITFVQYLDSFLQVLDLTDRNNAGVLVILKKERALSAILADDIEKSEDVILRELDKIALTIGSFKKAAISGNFGVLLLLDTVTCSFLSSKNQLESQGRVS